MANNVNINSLEMRAAAGDRFAMACLVEQLSSEDRQVKCQALFVLAKIMEASEPVTNAIIDRGVMDPLLSIFEATCNEAWSYRNQQVLANVTAALGFATFTRRDMIEKFFQRGNGLVQTMIDLLLHHDKKIRTNAFHVVSRWVSLAGTSEHTREVLRLGVLRKFPLFLELNSEQYIRQVSLRFLSNVVADCQYGVDEVIRSCLTHFVVYHLKQGSTEIKKESVRTIANMIHAGSLAHRRHLIASGVIPLLQNLLVGEFWADAEIAGIIKETLGMLGV